MTFVTAACLLGLPSLAKADETFSQTATIPVPGLASFDISWVDQTNHTYYLADRSNKSVDTYNITTGAINFFKNGNFVGPFVNSKGAVNNDLSGPNGILTFPNPVSGVTELWVGDGPQVNEGCPTYLNGICSAVKVLNANTGALLRVIPNNGAARADELCHDPTHHVVLIANDAESLDFSFGTPFITFISTDTYAITKQVLIPEASNGIEQCQYDAVTGLFFINIPEINGPGNDTADGAVYVYDPSGNLVARYFLDIAGSHCAGPQGMAIGPEPQILLGCNAPDQAGLHNSIVINKHTGATLSVAWGLGGTDEVWFNPTDSHYYLAQSSVTPPQLAIFDATGAAAVDQIIQITKLDNVSPHSVAADPATNKVFWPTAGGVSVYSPSGEDADDPASPAQPE